VRGNITAGIEYLTLKDPDFELSAADAEWVVQSLGADVAEPVRRAVLGNLKNRDLTRRAEALLRSGNTASDETLGALLDAHHAALRDDLDISTPRIEAILAAAKRAGAAGGKINGSGGGGCCFVWCPDAPDKTARAIENAGGKAYLISIDSGFDVFQ
jgi:galactokinase